MSLSSLYKQSIFDNQLKSEIKRNLDNNKKYRSRIKDLEKNYGSTRAVKGINLSINSGEIIR